jgi:hypothetical protein
MSRPDPADVIVARAADRLALIALQKNAIMALEFCEQLHELRADVRVSLRCDNNAPEPRAQSPMPAKFPGRCAACAAGIRVGEPIFYDSEAKKAVHARCR